MRGSARFITLAAALVLSASTALAQDTKAAGGEGSFKVGYTDIGPVIGLGGIGDAGLSFGGRFEHAFKALPNLNNGILGLEVGVDWYHYSFGIADYSLTYIPIGATVNYHFQVQSNKKIDPFVGLGLGYYVVNFSCPGTSACDNSYSNTLYFIGRAGLRYFIQPKIALYGDVGSGQGALHLGAMFKLGGGD